MKLEVLKMMLEKADRHHPLTREEIARTFLVSDRHARELIAQLREKGLPVCSTSKSSGYWLAKTKEDYMELRRELLARSKTINETVRKMDKHALGSLEGQVTINDLLS